MRQSRHPIAEEIEVVSSVPERRLLAALLKRVWMDLNSGATINEMERRLSREWLETREQDCAFSFEYCANELDLDPGMLKREFLKRIE